EEIRDITQALVQAGNAKIGKIFIFSGSKTFTQPLQENDATHPATIGTDNLDQDLQFLLDPEQFSASFEGFSQHPYIVRIV
ncbi:MAG: hypothetical protein GWN09_02155, partial [Gammaproteobacteria bacterium]|nr:hypothetical protein [Gammaproteobacteria bacterium]